MDRLATAYLLIGLLVVFAIGGVAYWRYHSEQRTYKRHQAQGKKGA
ncbi:hypothetical protein KRR38_18095 [Novosphingobium sp. G106]|nr:hypothetical protein [Novosphingobium sp. G106]MBV1689538.1 hypothetical protein [Novosphingobium sp. G106]